MDDPEADEWCKERHRRKSSPQSQRDHRRSEQHCLCKCWGTEGGLRRKTGFSRWLLHFCSENCNGLCDTAGRKGQNLPESTAQRCKRQQYRFLADRWRNARKYERRYHFCFRCIPCISDIEVWHLSSSKWCNCCSRQSVKETCKNHRQASWWKIWRLQRRNLWSLQYEGGNRFQWKSDHYH